MLMFAAVFFSRVHYVDPKPAVAFGDDYFLKLKQSQIDDAFAMYTSGFLQKRGKFWQKIVGDLDAQAGRVTDFKVLGAQVAPVTLRDSTEIPCILIQYQVTRSRLIFHENLTVCPNQGSEEFGIAGHEITRSDNGQHFAAGLTMQQETIFSTK